MVAPIIHVLATTGFQFGKTFTYARDAALKIACYRIRPAEVDFAQCLTGGVSPFDGKPQPCLDPRSHQLGFATKLVDVTGEGVDVGEHCGKSRIRDRCRDIHSLHTSSASRVLPVRRRCGPSLVAMVRA